MVNKRGYYPAGLKNHWEEINFFRNIKPYILSKLIYHNKIFRIQTACPVDGGKMYASYFSEQLRELKQEYREHIYNSDFYRYYRSGRTDRDETYLDRKSTRLNSSHVAISYAVFCLKK